MLLLAPAACLAQQSHSVVVRVQVADGAVYMQGEVNQSGPLSMVLDTGSSLSVVSPSIAARLHLDVTSSGQAAGLAKGASDVERTFAHAGFRWGNATDRLQLRDQQGVILPIDYISEQLGKRAGGIFGSNLFRHYTVTVDYQRQRVAFNPTNVDTAHDGTPIPIQINSDVPFVQVGLYGTDGKRVTGTFVVDSGSVGTAMVLNRKFLAAHPGLLPSTGFVATPTPVAVGGKIPLQRVKVPRVQLGPFSFSNVVAVVPKASVGLFASGDVAGTVGTGILTRFTVTWDYAHHKMWLQPNDALKAPFTTDGSGLGLVAVGPEYRATVINAVLPGSPGASAGLTAGKRITAVNGEPNLPLWKIKSLLRGHGRTVTLTVSHGARARNVSIRLRSPFQSHQ